MPDLHIGLVEPEGYAQAALERYRDLGVVEQGPFSRDALLERASDFEILVVRLGHQLDGELLERAPRLRAIVSPTTGLDHIDVGTCERRGITVLSLRGETDFLRSVRATVEHTFALLLTLARRTHRAAGHVEAGGWDRDRYRGTELAGLRLGVLGFGRIGSAVAALGRAFGMEVTAYDPYQDVDPSLAESVDSLDALAYGSDVLTIHVPLNDETRGLVGRELLPLLPAGALLVNTSRGAVLDEAALLDSLRGGHLGGAALDVLAAEEVGPPRPGHPLVEYARNHDNLVITPHIGGATRRSMHRTEIFMADKLATWLQGSGQEPE